MKSGNINLLEPSGPLHACNGTDLTFYTKEASLDTSLTTAKLGQHISSEETV